MSDFDIDRYVEQAAYLFEKQGAHLTPTQLAVVKHYNGRFADDSRYAKLITASAEKHKESKERQSESIKTLKKRYDESLAATTNAEQQRDVAVAKQEQLEELSAELNDAKSLLEQRVVDQTEELEAERRFAEQSKRNAARYMLAHRGQWFMFAIVISLVVMLAGAMLMGGPLSLQESLLSAFVQLSLVALSSFGTLLAFGSNDDESSKRHQGVERERMADKEKIEGSSEKKPTP